jgi:NitT/TauT family transport system permease protein
MFFPLSNREVRIMKPSFFGLHAQLRPTTRFLLGLIPFVLLVGGYWIASEIRLDANPSDKLLPSFTSMGEAVWRMAFVPDKRTGAFLWWSDTTASLVRLGIGTFLGAITGLILGINMGLYPFFRAFTRPMVTVFSLVPPLTLLPILFITFGVEEAAKIVLIFIGTVFVITRDMYLATSAIPQEQITKALTLGASNYFGVTYRIVLPQVFPRLINATRLVLGAAWLFLIAAEAVASTDGLGYRIFLVRRYMAMDVIIPYVIWITLLGFTFDSLLHLWVKRGFPWYNNS